MRYSLKYIITIVKHRTMALITKLLNDAFTCYGKRNSGGILCSKYWQWFFQEIKKSIVLFASLITPRSHTITCLARTKNKKAVVPSAKRRFAKGGVFATANSWGRWRFLLFVFFIAFTMLDLRSEGQLFFRVKIHRIFWEIPELVLKGCVHFLIYLIYIFNGLWIR